MLTPNSVSPRFIPGPPHLGPHKSLFGRSSSVGNVRSGPHHHHRPSSSFSNSSSSVSRTISSFVSSVTGSSSSGSGSGSSSVASSTNSPVSSSSSSSSANYPQLQHFLGAITGTSSPTSMASTSASLRDLLYMTSSPDFLSKNRHFRQRADWGHNRLAALCAQHVVMIIDPHSMQWITSLDAHIHSTTAVSWCPMAHKSGTDRGNSSILASGDSNGHIVVWDVRHARPMCHFQEDGSVLNANNSPSSARGGGSNSNNYNGYNTGNLASSSSSSIHAIVQMHWMDMDNRYLLTLSACGMLSMWCLRLKRKIWSRGFFGEPVVSFSVDPFNKRRIIMCCDSGWVMFIDDLNTRSAPEQVEKKLRVGGTTDPKTGNVTSTVLRDFVFSPHAESQLYYVSKRDVSVYDLHLRQTLVGKSFAGTRADFRQIFTTEQDPNLLFSLHDDGNVTAWEFDPSRKRFESSYCDVVRGSKYGADRPGLLYGWAFAPYDPTSLVAISTDGRIWSWKFESRAAATQRVASVMETNHHATPKSKWVLRGMLEGLSMFILSMAVSPFNSEIVALGTINGLIVLLDLKTGNLLVKHEIFNSEVVTIRWLTPSSVIAFTTRSIGSNQFQNQISIIDLYSGQQTAFRTDRTTDSSPILAIRVSHSRRYMILLARDRPIEVWNLVERRLIRVIPVNNFTALDWCHVKIRGHSHDAPPSFSTSRNAEENKGEAVADIDTRPATATASITETSIPKKESFIFTTSDGSLYFYHIQTEKNLVVEDYAYHKVFVHSQITAISKVGNLIVCGDNFGNIIVIEPRKDQKVINTGRGMCMKLQFSTGGQFVLALFAKGDFGIWDIRNMKRVSHSLQNIPHVRAIAVEWAKDNHPVIATTTGSLAVYNVGLTTTNESFSFRSLSEPMKSMAMLPSPQAMHLRTLIEHGQFELPQDVCDNDMTLSELENSSDSFRNCLGQLITMNLENNLPDDDEQIQLHTSLLDDAFKAKLRREDLTRPERCMVSALYFGDVRAARFWTMAHQFLRVYKAGGLDNASNTIVSPMSTNELKRELATIDDESKSIGNGLLPPPDGAVGQQDQIQEQTDLNISSLPALYGLTRDNETVRKHQLSIVQSHDESIRASQSDEAASYYKQVAQEEAMLGQKDSAVRLLLETPPGHKDTYLNYLHALVIAASNGHEHFQQTVQFVSSSLISFRTEKDLLFGIELLVLIGEGYKACRLLQDFDMWERAASLSKCILPKDQSDKILTRWANHLTSTGRVLKAVGVWLSLGLFYEVLDLLHKQRMIDIAAQFARTCQEAGIDIADKGTIVPHGLMEPLHARTNSDELREQQQQQQQQQDEQMPASMRLLHQIYGEYSVHLEKIGCKSLSQEYASIAFDGEDGGEKSSLNTDHGAANPETVRS